MIESPLFESNFIKVICSRLIMSIVALAMLSSVSCFKSRNTCKDLGVEDYNKSIDYYKNKIKKEGISEESLYRIGMSYFKLQNYESAILYLDELINFSPEFVNAYSNKGLSLLLLGKKDKACQAFMRVLELGEDPKIINEQSLSNYMVENCQ